MIKHCKCSGFSSLGCIDIQGTLLLFTINDQNIFRISSKNLVSEYDNTVPTMDLLRQIVLESTAIRH